MSELLQGIVYDMPINEYHAQPHLSNSGIGHILKSPAHYRARTFESTPALRIGQAVHALALEPHRFDDMFAIKPDVDGRTKEGKATIAAWRVGLKPGQTELTQGEFDAADCVAGAIRTNDYIKRLGVLDPERAQHEVSVFSVVQTDEGPCYVRCRMDAYVKALGCIFDIKTTEDATRKAFLRSVERYGYHIQAALYHHVCRAEGIKLLDDAFVMIAAEKGAPNGVQLYALDDQAIEQGHRDFMRAATIWAKCYRTGEWPSYPYPVQYLSLSPWMIDSE